LDAAAFGRYQFFLLLLSHCRSESQCTIKYYILLDKIFVLWIKLKTFQRKPFESNENTFIKNKNEK